MVVDVVVVVNEVADVGDEMAKLNKLQMNIKST